MLETICGFLDVGTLCTARLLCTHFRRAASRCIHAVELSVVNLRSQLETNLNNFPNLSRVSVFDVEEDDVLMLAQSPVADAVTHVRAAEYLRLVPRSGESRSCLQPLPSLMSLTVSHPANGPFPFPETLKELTLEGLVNDQTANLVARLTKLTCLRIELSGICKPFLGLTALTGLQRLEIRCQSPSIPLVGELTLLTHLQVKETQMWMGMPFFMPHFRSIWSSNLGRASLTRLQRLVHLEVGPIDTIKETQFLASIGTITSLRSLHLDLGGSPARLAFEPVRMAPFSQLTALRLETSPTSCVDASFVPRLNLERLQDLSLSDGLELRQDGLAALRQATGLTNLELWTRGGSMGPQEALGVALSRMPRLRALSLGTTEACQAPFYAKAIGLLTGLTRLILIGAGLSIKANVDLCLGLNKLRVLRLTNPCFVCAAPTDRITPETVFALAKLPELRNLDISGCFSILGWHSTACRIVMALVQARVNTERHDKGWRPLELHITKY